MTEAVGILDTTTFDPAEYNIIGAPVVAELTPYHKRVVSRLKIQSNPDLGEVYKVQNNASTLALTKPSLMRIADLAGVCWNYAACKAIEPTVCQFCRMAGDNCKTCDHHGTIAYRAVGMYQDAVGQPRLLVGTAEVDPSERTRAGNDGKTEGERMKSHLLRHVEARAFNAAVRSLGMKQWYSPQELQKPFIVIRTYYDAYSDPDLKAALIAREVARIRAISDLPALPNAMAPELIAATEAVVKQLQGPRFTEVIQDMEAGARIIDQATGEITTQPAAPPAATPAANGTDAHGPAQTNTDGNGHGNGNGNSAVLDGQQALPWNAAEVPQLTDERPRTLTATNGEEFCAAVYKWLPRYRDASHPGKVNTFSMMASLNRVGVKTLSDPRAWPHLCMRNDAEGGKAE